MQTQNGAKVTSPIIKAHIDSLYRLKDKAIEAKCFPQAWPAYFLSNPVIGQFLIWVIKVMKRENMTEIKSWIKQIINPIDLTLIKLSEKHIVKEIFYCDKKSGTSDINVIALSFENIAEYFSILKRVLVSLPHTKNDLNTVSNGPTFKYIEQLTDYFKTHMKKSKQKYEILLIDTLLVNLSYNPEKNRLGTIFEDDLLYFCNHLDKYVHEYFKIPMEDTTKHQVFMIRLGITLAINHPRKNEMIGRIIHHIIYIKESLENEFSPKISNLLEKFSTSEGYDLKKILENLSNVSNSEEADIFSPSMATEVTATFPIRESSNNLQNMLNFFNITTQYPQKITFKDALVIRHEIPVLKIRPTDLPIVILNKIMAYDKKCRSVIIPCEILKSQFYANENEDSEDSHNDSSDSDYEDDSIDDGLSIVHPVDIIMILLHCSDNFLRQELFSKLSSCQIAVPLLLPDGIKNSITLLLWALRSIKNTWKAVDSHGKTTTKHCSIVDHEGAIVSFLKCGKKLQKSKSGLLNKVLGVEDAFFHWDLLEEQNCYKIISQGVVELCCYYPGKKESIFKDAVIFANLHGNAIQHPKQVEFIKAISFMCCILIKKKDLVKTEYIKILQKLATSPGGIIVILTDSKSYKENKLKAIIKCETASIVCLKDKTSAATESKIRHLILSKLDGSSHKFTSIAKYVETARKIGIKVDEDNEDCVLGKKAAFQMKQLICETPFTNIKNHFLPLQGPEMWQKWAIHEKEHHRHKDRKNQSPMEYKILKEREKDEIRYNQLECLQCTNFSPIIIAFLKNLLQCNESCRSYFLQWLKMYLGNISKDTLQELQIEYQNLKSEIEKVPSTDTVKINILKDKCKVQNQMLINASLGLEHFFREIGQVYETVHFKNKHKDYIALSNFDRNEINFLPMIAAKTLVEGFAMEIMDGEASHIPLTWVCAVISCLRKLYINKTLFILSILGVQSSGKSTLLNTMFGLRFNVSVARCTRGAFIQLLPLDDELKKELHHDFILIVDTEGLCAPELLSEGSEQHDNELATFVVGIADFTIINIYGETPANLSDILQTVLHAFIRMKEVDKNPGCLFVHQNVTEQLATEKLQPGKQILLEQLNILTQAVAKIEQCESNYTNFQDVIKFDANKDVYYFSSLWKGDPPMAPINLGYSECAQDLKQVVLGLLKNQKQFCTFEAFECRIQNLWTAILKENFIFNFKNTTEVAAYSELDLQYGDWSWKLQEVLERQLLLCENKIKSCNKQESIEGIKNTCSNDSIKVLNIKCDELCKELTTFIRKHDLANVMLKWDFDIKDRLKEKKKIFIETVKRHCDRLVHTKKNDQQKENLQQQYVNELRKQITDLVAKVESHNTATLEEIHKMFNTNWNGWIAKFKERITYIDYPSDKDIDGYIEASLGNNFQSDYSYLLETLEKDGLSGSMHSSLFLEVNDEKHVISNKKKGFFLWNRGSNNLHIIAQKETNSTLEKIRRMVENIIASKEEGFTPNLPDILLKEIFTAIDKFNKSSKDFSFTQAYKVDISVVACRYGAKKFKHWNNELKKQNDPILALQQQKCKFMIIFINKYRNVATEIAASMELCNSLIDTIATTVVNELHLDLVNHLKGTSGNFNSKPGFKVQILTDLAKQENFDAYKIFLVNSTVSYNDWAKLYVDNLCKSENSPFEEIAIEKLNQLLYTVTKEVQICNTSNSKEWLSTFCNASAISGKIEIKWDDWINDVKYVSNDLESMQHFKSNLIKELNSAQSMEFMKKKVHNECAKICEAAASCLCDSVINKTCTVECPFCSEQCDIMNSGHLNQKEPTLHHVRVHCPQCVSKVTWYDSKKLVLDVCNSLVESNCHLVLLDKDPTGKTTIPYKDYQREHPEWDIPGAKIDEPPMYWVWFVSHFYRNLVDWSEAKETCIDQNWKTITKSKAIDSLAKTYSVYCLKKTS